MPQRPDRRPVPDMTVHPAQPEAYRPPPDHACDVETFPISITETDQLMVRLHLYRHRTVDFAIMQLVRQDDTWVEVSRIDCCHGTIHRHQFDRTGVDLYDHKVIMDIPASRDDAWAVVGAGYDDALDVMMTEYDENLRRWRG